MNCIQTSNNLHFPVISMSESTYRHRVPMGDFSLLRVCGYYISAPSITYILVLVFRILKWHTLAYLQTNIPSCFLNLSGRILGHVTIIIIFTPDFYAGDINFIRRLILPDESYLNKLEPIMLICF